MMTENEHIEAYNQGYDDGYADAWKEYKKLKKEELGNPLPYCIIIFPYEKYVSALDRGYNFIEIPSIPISDIIEIDDNTFYPQFGEHAAKLIDEGHKYYVIWTNYYE